MNVDQILRAIDDGAEFYIGLFADAAHMERVDCEHYTFVTPKSGGEGIRFVYNIHLENLPEEVQRREVEEIRALGMPVWLSLRASDALYRMMFGRDRPCGQADPGEEDEVYMALLPEEYRRKRVPVPEGVRIRRVGAAQEFARWAKVANDVLAGGHPDLHPVGHYPLCERGLLRCYLAEKEGLDVAVAAIADNGGEDSLEFVATIPALRRQGLARAVCMCAVEEAFADGARIVTARAANAAAAQLYRSLGFVAYPIVPEPVGKG